MIIKDTQASSSGPLSPPTARAYSVFLYTNTGHKPSALNRAAQPLRRRIRRPRQHLERPTP